MNARPARRLPITNRFHRLAHRARQTFDIDSARVADGLRDSQSFFDPLHSRAPLSRLRVMDPDAELQEDADEVRLVANAFEEKLFEDVARLQEVAGVEKFNAMTEARIVGDIQDVSVSVESRRLGG